MVKEYTLCAFNYFKFIKVCLWPMIQSILVYFPWALENNVYYCVVMWSVPISII